MTFTEKQRSTIINAIYVANERFREDIAEIEGSSLPLNARERLCTTFLQQIKDGEDVLRLLEE